MIRLVLGLAAALTLVACGQVDERLPERAGEEERPSGESLADFLACARQFTVDYEPADTPAALARKADVVVTGTMVDVRPGEPYAPHVPLSVLEVKVDRVVTGDKTIVSKRLCLRRAASFRSCGLHRCPAGIRSLLPR